MTKGEFLNHLTVYAKEYRKIAIKSVAGKRHMNQLKDSDIIRIRRNREIFERFADAILVDFINYAGARNGVDYAIYTKDL